MYTINIACFKCKFFEVYPFVSVFEMLIHREHMIAFVFLRQVGKDLLDVSDSGSSTTSLIILQQLKDKQRAHEYIINFLKKLNLWDKVSYKDVFCF